MSDCQQSFGRSGLEALGTMIRPLLRLWADTAPRGEHAMDRGQTRRLFVALGEVVADCSSAGVPTGVGGQLSHLYDLASEIRVDQVRRKLQATLFETSASPPPAR
jgi:hypothetical protein